MDAPLRNGRGRGIVRKRETTTIIQKEVVITTRDAPKEGTPLERNTISDGERRQQKHNYLDDKEGKSSKKRDVEAGKKNCFNRSWGRGEKCSGKGRGNRVSKVKKKARNQRKKDCA